MKAVRRSLATAAMVLAAASCRTPASAPDEPTVVPSTALDPAVADDAGPSLSELADAIDPGPRAALTVGLPPWLAASLGVETMPSDPVLLLERARAAVRSWEARPADADDSVNLEGIVGLVRALAQAERAAGTVENASVDALLVLERVYALMDQPMLANDRNLFARMVQRYVAMATNDGQTADSAALEELARLVFDGLSRAGDLHRRTVAALLRGAPEHEAIPGVLSRLASKILAQDEALAVGASKRALRLRGTSATASHWLELASLCHRALDVPCGRRALAAAEALAEPGDDKTPRRLALGRTLAEHAVAAVELADSPGLEDGLARGKALFELWRYDDALEQFTRLHRRHPDDARPVFGMATAVLSDELDFVRVLDIVDRAAPRDHFDRDWYELTIGVRATALTYHALPQLAGNDPQEVFAALRPSLLQMRSDIEALEALGADEGRVLRFVYDLAMEAWLKVLPAEPPRAAQWLRGGLARTTALRAEVPNSHHAYRMLLASALFSDDRNAAMATLELEPPPTEGDVLLVRRAQAAFDLVVAWDAEDRVEAMLGFLDPLDGPKRPRALRRLAVDAHVVAKRLGRGDEDWAALERRYAALREEAGAERDAVLLNNLGVVMVEQGRYEPAIAAFEQAMAHAEDSTRDIPRLNAVATRLVSGQADRAATESVALVELTGGTPMEVRLQAQAWRVAMSGGKAKTAATRALRELAAKEASESYRPRHLPMRAGVIMRGNVQFGLGYSSLEGMELELDTTGVPWLMVPCPVAIPDPRD